ncbi:MULTISPECIES: flagellar filament capping protein FliD [unclassified Pseudomonas]|uniref:flagellar filament capping protein FliD n=1 Tax=unclassified Pseudomonas TaxID=196821 RepID=UPI002446A9EE|nr:flagellar filament capping protein FliD [Pseudomonas sp. GD03944]MDH1264443.1 flagellar filament capping protein FliD [Pseudomonas sp. GD03944]HWV11507.1 flagellar filament capping protein FliD [Pseudomonas sp.]
MAIDSDYVKQMSSQLASYEVQAALAKANRNEASYKAQLSAVSTLESALKTFSSSIKGMKSAGSTMLINSAKFSQEGYATATVGTNAVPGNYQFFVEQLASRHQVSVGGLQPGDLGSGTLTIGQDGKSFNVDVSGASTLEELASAINGAADNSGVKATLVRSNGEVSLVLSSEKSGADNAISLSSSGNAALATALSNQQELSKAQDAQVRLGGENGMLLTNASNTFENIIDGVSLTFNRAHKAGDQPLSVDIGQDSTATKEKAQAFVTALNSLMSSFDSLTASGGETSTRGVLAGDSSIRSIENMLNQVLRTEYGGASLMEFGIVADRNGKLTIDGARFDKAVAANPEGFEKLFTDKGALLDSIDKNLAVYTSSANGLMKTRKDSLNSMLRRVDDQFDNIQKQYDSYYSRYLKQYTSMMQTMSAMEQTYGMF